MVFTSGKRCSQVSKWTLNLPDHTKNSIVNLYQSCKTELGVTTHERRCKFEKLISLYYPWFGAVDKSRAYACIAGFEETFALKTLMNTLMEEYHDEMLKLFGKADKDGNGYLDFTEFQLDFGRILGKSKEELEILFKQADTDENGKLDLIEFFNFVAKSPSITAKLHEFLKQKRYEVDTVHSRKHNLLFKENTSSPSIRRPSLTNLRSYEERVKGYYIFSSKF
jgi:hypothetical protein